MYKYMSVKNSDLLNHLLNQGYKPLYLNNIFTLTNEIMMEAIGWCQKTGAYMRRGGSNYCRLTEKELELELMFRRDNMKEEN